ncbi:MAG: hypothetical protein SWE60_25265, partial [Thermodesulfobacteriota bacterium]|nr:hypothetical protein [Thermodesulfobacteriota bacterium]
PTLPGQIRRIGTVGLLEISPSSKAEAQNKEEKVWFHRPSLVILYHRVLQNIKCPRLVGFWLWQGVALQIGLEGWQIFCHTVK